jgi:hypothetical protein
MQGRGTKKQRRRGRRISSCNWKDQDQSGAGSSLLIFLEYKCSNIPGETCLEK